METKKRNINPNNPPGPKGNKSKMLTMMVDDLFFNRLCEVAERKNKSNSEALRNAFNAYYNEQNEYHNVRLAEQRELLNRYEAGEISKAEYEKQCFLIKQKDY